MPTSVPSRLAITPAAAILLCAGAALAQPATFQRLPHDFKSGQVQLTSLSADGQRAAGFYLDNNDARIGFLWTAPAGTDRIPEACAAIPDTEVQAISGDGTTVVGMMYFCGFDPNCPSCLNIGAAKWSEATGAVYLGMLPGGEYIGDTFSGAMAVSHDGSVVVGVSPGWDIEFEDEPYFRPFRWTAPGGIEDLGPIADSQYAAAVGVSGDGGTVLVESLMFITDGGGVLIGTPYFGMLWTQAGGYAQIPFTGLAPDVENLRPRAISADGSTVVGIAHTRLAPPSGRVEAFRWSTAGGAVERLSARPDLGFPNARALGVSGDGSVVYGDVSGTAQRHPVIWDGGESPRLLAEVLTQGGADLTGWSLREITGISADGTTLVGYGIRQDPEAGLVVDSWIATIGGGGPECPADWNQDTQVNSADITAFLTDWIASLQHGTLAGDFDGNGQVNSADITTFLTAWLAAVQEGGC